MTDKPEDKFIDELFRDSIDNVETEPSANFWNKAYDSILAKENGAYTKKLWRLRGITIALGLSVAGLIGYNAYTTVKLSNTVQKMAGLEKQQAVNNDHSANTPAANPVNKNIALNASQPVAAQNVQHDMVNDVQANSSSPVIAANTEPKKHVSVNRQVSPASTTMFSYTYPKASRTLAGNISTSVSVRRQARANSLIYLDERTPITIPPQDKIDSLIFADVEDDDASVKPIVHRINEQIVPILPAPSKFSVSAYFAPSVANPVLKDNYSIPGVSASDVKSREHEQVAYTAGANVGFDISSRFTVQLGVEYRNYKFSVAPEQVDATTGDMNSGYSYVTSSGIINMPYISAYTPLGYYDTVATAKGTATRSYISIPLHLRYYFLKMPKYELYVTAGASMNILTANYVTVHCQNSWGEEDLYLYNAEGARTVNFSSIAGFGAAWELKHGFSMFVEPSYSAAITSNTKNSPVTTYSNYFDVAAGITYHF